MLIGTMNHPAKDVVSEIEWMANLGMEFIDLTLEPPAAASWNVDVRGIRRVLEANHMQVVGHTAFYLPLASALEEIRCAAVAELRRCLDKFGEIGAHWMNLHPDRWAPMHDRAFFIRRNIQTIEELLPHGERCGVGLMIENLPGEFNSPQQLGELLDPLPELGLHLDIGHANLQVPHNMTREILKVYGKRLRHVHLHDNKGGHEDLHMPLGTGSVDFRSAFRGLHECGYDDTMTLEVFTPDRHYLTYSAEVVRRAWRETAIAQPAGRM